LLIFFNPECGFCREMMPKLAAFFGVRWQAERDAALSVDGSTARSIQSAVTGSTVQNDGDPSPGEAPQPLILSTGDAGQNREFFRKYKINCPVLLQKEMEVATAYQANGTPSGYLISSEGRIASGLAMGAEALLALAAGKSEVRNPKPEQDQSLLTSAATGDGDGRASRFTSRSLARSKIKRDGLKAGTPAPGFSLPRVNGRGDLTLSDLRGKRVLLVFSSPDCGPCSKLAPQLEKFHREHPELEMVMVSKGELKENRAKLKEYRLSFPVLLQQQWEISRRYAMFATPIAYLIDEAGVIANVVAVGVELILSLLTVARRQSGAKAPATRSSVNAAFLSASERSLQAAASHASRQP
jgi:peroxiredoxin